MFHYDHLILNWLESAEATVDRSVIVESGDINGKGNSAKSRAALG